MLIPKDFNEYMSQNANIWAARLTQAEDFEQTIEIANGLPVAQQQQLVQTSLSYVSVALNEIQIQQQALEMLRSGEEPTVVSHMLQKLGRFFAPVNLTQTLIQGVAVLFQNIISVIQNFIQNIQYAMNMKITKVVFNFALSPTVSIEFT